ncbi:hypothetical protein P167DRAFT_540720 [Morchella conica CCBAS932]|uniref:Uncharacterized protein n=1 Tax=Morchella conica CCBAS932 TaxID=1392247 RepID=A0A3N4K7Q3_9PEZI|nr:hypothetical protein P167DRAFT_540720 [Morchella conica CCBAS932]
MSLRSHPLGKFLSLGSLQLGCLVQSAKNPQQDLHNPFESRPTDDEFNVVSHKNLRASQNSSNTSKFRSYLSDALSSFRETRSTAATSLMTPEATTYELKNSGKWFKDACKNPETQEWIEETINENRNIYLVVGFLIVKDAQLSRTLVSRTKGGMGAEVLANPLPTGGMVSITTLISLTSGVQFSNEAAYGQMSVFDMPGDHIIAVRYRKVQHKWFQSRKVNNLFLEEGTRWKSDFKWRGDEDEDEDEDEDILDATLTGVEDMDILEEVNKIDEDMSGINEPASRSPCPVTEQDPATTSHRVKRKWSQDAEEETPKRPRI